MTHLERFIEEVQAAKDYTQSHKEYETVLLRELRHLLAATGMTRADIIAEINSRLSNDAPGSN